MSSEQNDHVDRRNLLVHATFPPPSRDISPLLPSFLASPTARRSLIAFGAFIRFTGISPRTQERPTETSRKKMLAGGRQTAAIAGGRIVQKSALVAGRAPTAQLQVRSFYSLYEKYSEAYKRFGWKLSLWKLYNPGDIKFGKEVGEDEFGNKYYEDPTELHLMHRWTEFKVDSFEEFEGTKIPPQWHLWLQHTTDALPTDPGQNPENWAKVPISSTSDAPFKNHVAPHVPYYPNKTMYRSRGYGVGSLETKPDEPDQFYIQPNHVLRNRKRLKANFFDEIDYNNPDAPAKNSSEPLRPATKN